MNYTGMGAEPGQVTVPTRTVQEALARIGLDIGAAGADGIWGSTTDRAFAAALSRTGMSTGYRVSADKRSVEMPSGAWVTIQALAAGSPPPATPATPPSPRPSTTPGTVIAPSEPVILPESGGTNLVPWIIGGSVLAAIGLYLWFTPVKPVRANRRRRMRRNTGLPRLKPGRGRVYIVYVDGVEVGMIRASGHNAAEKKAQAKYPGRHVSVAYTEI